MLTGSCTLVEQLLCAGMSDANFQQYDDEPWDYTLGMTPLMIAAEKGDTDKCRLLLSQHDADVDATRNEFCNCSALHYAIFGNHRKTVLLLLEYGATAYDQRFGSPETFDSSPIGKAVKYFPEIVDELMDHCNQYVHKIPLDLLFNEALEGPPTVITCSILTSTLRRGYYPPQWRNEFRTAAHNGHQELMGLIMELNPRCLQEEWCVERYELTGLLAFRILHKDFVNWLIEYRKRAPSLQQLCKSTILSQLGQYYIPKINQLPLPKSLMKYLRTLESQYKT